MLRIELFPSWQAYSNIESSGCLASVMAAAQGLVHTVGSVTVTWYSIPSLPRVNRSTICSVSREPRGWKKADAEVL